jgi:membrane protein implicated in regulation of membrane protease activity
MSMDGFEIAYWVCFLVGLGFALLSGILAGVFSGAAEAHVDVGGHHVDMGQGAEGHVHFPILSPVTLSMAILAFGGAGLIFKKMLLWPASLHLPAAAVCGVITAFVVAWLLWKVFSVTQGSSQGTAEEAVGLPAEVTVAIPHQGLGEIAYTLRGSRMLNPAQTLDGKELPPGSPVKIVKLVGNTYFVEKAK